MKRRKFWLIFSALFLAAVFAVLIFLPKGAEIKPKEKTASASRNGSAAKNLMSDSDGDGLLDWEEKLYGTDINNPDTDGDGLSDKEELDKKRNPAIPGPDDVLPAQNLTESAPTNLTDGLMKMMDNSLTKDEIVSFSNNPQAFAANPKKIPSFNSPGFNKGLAGLLSGARQKLSTSPSVKPKVLVGKDDSKEARVKYLKSVIAIMQKRLKFDPEVSADLIETSIRYSDSSLLDSRVKALVSAENDLRNLETPKSWVGVQEKLIALVGAARETTISFQNANDDPLYAALGFSNLAALDNSFVNLAQEMNNKMKNQNIAL